MTVVEPVDLPRVKGYLSINATDSTNDPMLLQSITYCRDRLESVLPYYIAERDVVRVYRPSSLLYRPFETIDLKGPVVSINSITLKTMDGDVPVTDYVLDVNRVILEDLPSYLTIVINYKAGAYVPPVVENAILMMVKSRYERRDEDPLTADIMNIIYPETRPNI